MDKRWMFLGMLTLVAGCQKPHVEAPPPLIVASPEQRADMQTRMFNASYDAVFASTLAVLQDLGWQLGVVDKDSGLIRASTAKRSEALSPSEESITDYDFRRRAFDARSTAMNKWTRWEELTIHTEPWAGAGTRQRIVILRRGSLPPMTYRTSASAYSIKKAKEVLVNAPAQEDSVELQLAEAYADLFDRISAEAKKRPPAP